MLLSACHAPPEPAPPGRFAGGAPADLVDPTDPTDPMEDSGIRGDAFADWGDAGTDGGGVNGDAFTASIDGGTLMDAGAPPETPGDGAAGDDATEPTNDAGAEDAALPDATSEGEAGDGALPDSADDGGGPSGAPCALPLAASPEDVGMSREKLQQAVDTAHGWVESGAIIGGALLVTRYGKIVVYEAFGWADRERGIPMATDTVFDIASDSKPMTGVAALMLHEEQRLGLDEAASNHLTSWDNDASRDITVYQLLTHTSGLPSSLNSYESLAQMVDQIGAEGPDLSPGTEYRYSDRGSNSLGRLVEVIAGMPVEDFITDRIIAPLGLVDTFGLLEGSDPRRSRVAAKYEGGPGNWSKSWDNTEPSTEIFAPAYGLHSTVLDYGCFLETMLRDGERNGVRLLGAETVRLATRPHSDYVYPPGERDQRNSYYGLHWHVTITGYDPDNWDRKAHMFGHGGAWGTTAWVDRLHDLVFVYFTQSRDTETLLELRGLVHDARID